MPGSSKHEWWLDKVNKGTCCGFVSMIEASISLLYIRVWFNHAAKKQKQRKQWNKINEIIWAFILQIILTS